MSNNPHDGEPADRSRDGAPGPHTQPPSQNAQWGQPAQWGQQPPPAPQWGAQPGWQGVPHGQFRGYQAPPKPGIIPLRPLGLGEILDGAFQACRKNPLATFGTAILFQVLISVLILLLTVGLVGSLAQLDPNNPSLDQITGLAASAISVGTAIMVLSSVGVLVLQGVLVIPIARAVLNERTGFVQLWKLAARRILPLLGLGFLLLLMIVAGLAILVVVAGLLAAVLGQDAIWIIVLGFLASLALIIWLSIKFVLAPAVLMLESAGPLTSLRRSWTLTTCNWWRTFGILILTSIIVSIITSVISTPLSLLATQFVSFSDSPAALGEELMASLPILLVAQLITAVFGAIGYAFQAGVTALLYVDLRIRREGFDVVLLREHEEAHAGRFTPIPGQSANPGGQQFGHRPGGPPAPPVHGA
ncbi:hypothetical protein ACX80O_00660 [Arthrobacter sp. Hz1]